MTTQWEALEWMNLASRWRLTAPQGGSLFGTGSQHGGQLVQTHHTQDVGSMSLVATILAWHPWPARAPVVE